MRLPSAPALDDLPLATDVPELCRRLRAIAFRDSLMTTAR